MTEPQLPAEMEKRFDEEFPEEVASLRHVGKLYGASFVTEKIESVVIIDREKAKHFLATALEEQNKKLAEKIKLQREYYDQGHRGDNPRLSGYLNGLDFVLSILNGKDTNE